MSPSAQVAALALRAAQRSPMLAHINFTSSSFSSSATVKDPSTSSLSSATYLSVSLRAKAGGPPGVIYGSEDASTASSMASKDGKPSAKKTAATSLPTSDAVSVAKTLNGEDKLAKGEGDVPTVG